MDAASWVTAFGTAALAIATFVYVRSSREATDAAKKSAASAEASVHFAALSLRAAERAMLAEAMPVLITEWSATAHGPTGSLNFTVKNVGRSTALNGRLRYGDIELELSAVPPGGHAPAVHAMEVEVVDRIVTPPSERVEIEYEDAIGNQLRTICSVGGSPNRPMYETSLRVVDGWAPLKAP